jgi:hypothetical protein
MNIKEKKVILYGIVHCVGFVTFSHDAKGFIATSTNFGHFFCLDI